MEDKKSWVSYFIIGTFVTLYLLVSIISTIHVVEFFELSNPQWLAISLAAAFEIGAAASLASLIALKKMNRNLVWMLFILLTAMQAMGNTYYAYVNLADFTAWSELFGLIEEDLIYQKRILSIVSGAVLPIVALGFIKSLVDYIKPEEPTELSFTEDEETKDADKLDGGNSDLPEIPINEPKIENFEKSELLTDASSSIVSPSDELITSANANKKEMALINGPGAMESPSPWVDPTRLG
jgi:hypothetical protein